MLQVDISFKKDSSSLPKNSLRLTNETETKWFLIKKIILN